MGEDDKIKPFIQKPKDDFDDDKLLTEEQWLKNVRSSLAAIKATFGTDDEKDSVAAIEALVDELEWVNKNPQAAAERYDMNEWETMWRPANQDQVIAFLRDHGHNEYGKTVIPLKPKK